MYRTLPFVVSALLFMQARAYAQTQVLDLLPAEGVAGLVVRDLDELRGKGDKFVEDAGLKVPLRPSQLFDLGFQFLGVNAGLDTKKPVAILLNNTDLGVEHVVVALPFADLDALAASFGLKKGELQPGRMTRGTPQNFGQFLYARGKHLFLGNNEKALERVLKAKTLSTVLSPAQRASYNSADLVLHFGPRAMGREWNNFVNALGQKIGKRDEAGEQKVIDELLASLGQVSYGLAALRVDNGLGLTFTAGFAKDDGGAARRFLATLGSGSGAADLKGLPQGNVIAAQALRGDGSKTGLIAKVLFDSLLQHFLDTKEVLSAMDRPVVVGLLTEVWNRLQGSRAGLYLNDDEQKLGLFSLLAILDTEDASRFLADMKMLARIADGTGLDISSTGKTEERLDVGQLVKDLGNVKFRVRESASLKLRLVGEPALPVLEKVLGSSDLEVTQRVQKLRSQIMQAAAERRRDLLGQNLVRRLQPSFALVPDAERRRGRPVDVVRIKLAGQNVLAEKPLRQIFGPEWANLRLVVHGRQIVFLLGSDVRLLEAALKNLDDGTPGLAAAKGLQPFARTGSPSRKVEFHASVAKILALTSPQAGRRRDTARIGDLTSFGLMVEPDLLQLDVWLPIGEAKVIPTRW